MVFNRFGAIAAATVAVFASAAPASACRVYAVEGYTGGPSHFRMVARPGETCSIPHWTVLPGGYGRNARVIKSHVFQPTAGKAWRTGNRVAYSSGRGSPNVDRFAYQVRDRAGFDYDMRVAVTHR